MTFNLLISCMHQRDKSIIERSNVQSDVVVINQCDHNSVEEFNFINNEGKICRAKFICTTERGLSKSRNMAIRNAWGDVCQICDDDEVMADDNEQIIIKAYKENPDVGLIAFSLIRKDCQKEYPQRIQSLGLKRILKTSSPQITFSRSMMEKYGISFDEKMGSGTGNGGGEENKFMLDWRKAGAKMLYYPDVIATINPGESRWFHGYDDRYFQNLGWTFRRLLGNSLGMLYLIYWPIFHKKCYENTCAFSIFKIFKYCLQGYFSKR